MTWFLLALGGHLSNGVAFIIDKILLRTAFRRSATYAGMVGLLSSVVLLAIPFVTVWPQGNMWWVAIASGMTFTLALWGFFAALSRAEASRIIPIVGSLIPILTLVGTFTFLGERLADRTFLGFGFLILATILLSSGGQGRPSSEAIWLSVTSAMLFAVSSVTAKSVYDTAGFFGGFVTTRIAAAAAALIILTIFDRAAGKEALSIVNPPPKHKRTKKHPSAASAALALVGQMLGSVGFILVQWAMASGSASIVNSMQAIQYALLVVVAFALTKRAPLLLGENLTRNVVLIKIGALLLTGLGMYLIV